jgi:nucleoid-associated protein YgaU
MSVTPAPVPIAPAAPTPATMPPPLQPTPTPIVSKPTLQQGSTGPDVVTWQRIVGVAADGKFGPGTKTATIEWQKKKGLVADGIVGPKSWAAAIPMAAAGGVRSRTRYKVKRKDTPFAIAKKYTGDPNRIFELAEANPHAKQAIENGILFEGQVLNLPPTWIVANPATQAASALAGVLEIIGGAHAAGSRGHHWGA